MSRKERKDGDLRRVFLKTGVISHAKGSSYIEVGDTKVKFFFSIEICKRNSWNVSLCQWVIYTVSARKICGWSAVYEWFHGLYEKSERMI